MKGGKDADFWDVEFSGVDLGDERLNSRLVKTIKLMAEQPTASINQACGNWSTTKGAYRFFDNDKVEGKDILDAHGENCFQRLKPEPLVLIIQDTSFLNYTEHFKTEDLGRIGFVNKKETKSEAKGLVAHTAFAITPEGLPIGILDQQIWTRDPKLPFSRKLKNRKRIAIENKESKKWLDGLDNSLERVPRTTTAVTICDRESDLYEFIAHAETLKTKYLIRSAWNRSVRNESGETKYLWDHMKIAPVSGKFEIEVEGPRYAKQKVIPDRIAKMELRYSTVELRRPPKKKVNRKECLPYFKSYVVWVYEVDAPKDVEPLSWMLLTNLMVNNFEEAHEKVLWYKLRWHIETFHKTLKSGCNIEACRLQSAEKLERFVIVSSIIAWRIYWLTHMHRSNPEADCEEVLSEHEWKALYTITKKTKKIPKQKPTAREVTRWIAQLGGFLARKGDGEPGITTVWRGWQRLTVLSQQWEILNSE